MEHLLLSKSITFHLPAVEVLLADLQAILLQLLFPQILVQFSGSCYLTRHFKLHFSVLLTINWQKFILLQGLFSTQISLEVYTIEGGTVISHSSRPWLQSLDANSPRLARNKFWGLEVARC